MGIWYLSFADDDGFLGATHIEARDAKEAVRKSHLAGANPGGEAMLLELSKEDADRFPRRLLGILLNLEELQQHCGPVVWLNELDG